MFNAFGGRPSPGFHLETAPARASAPLRDRGLHGATRADEVVRRPPVATVGEATQASGRKYDLSALLSSRSLGTKRAPALQTRGNHMKSNVLAPYRLALAGAALAS